MNTYTTATGAEASAAQRETTTLVVRENPHGIQASFAPRTTAFGVEECTIPAGTRVTYHGRISDNYVVDERTGNLITGKHSSAAYQFVGVEWNGRHGFLVLSTARVERR